jgi:hypothetical protein
MDGLTIKKYAKVKKGVFSFNVEFNLVLLFIYNAHVLLYNYVGFIVYYFLNRQRVFTIIRRAPEL